MHANKGAADTRCFRLPTPHPVADDAFEIVLATASLGVFATLDQAIAALKTLLRSRVGEVLNRADMVEGRIAAQSLVAQTERSNAEDLDMIEGTSEFQSWQSGYEAALKAYSSVQRMSLFQSLTP